MLTSHPDVASFPETHLFFKLRGRGHRVSRWAFAGTGTDQKFEQFLRRVGRPEMIGRLPAFRPFLWQYVHLFIDVLDGLAAEQNKTHWVEKTPDHLLSIGLIETFIPNALFIHMIRNGRDVVASLIEAYRRYPEHFDFGQPKWAVHYCVRKWNEAIRQSQKYAVHQNHFLVRYERLVEQPAAVLGDLCSFLGIGYDPDMLDRRVEATSGIVSRGEAWKDGVKGDIKRVGSDKYERLFDQDQKTFIANHLIPLDRAFRPWWFSPSQWQMPPSAAGTDVRGGHASPRPRILFVRSEQSKVTANSRDRRLKVLWASMQNIGDVTEYRVTSENKSRIWPFRKKKETPDTADTAAFSCARLDRHRPNHCRVKDMALLHPEAYDVVFFDRLSSCWWTGWTDPQRAIVDVGKVPSQRYGQSLSRGRLMMRVFRRLRFHRLRRSERRVLECFRYSLVCSDAEQQYLNHPRASRVPHCYWPQPGMDEDLPDAEPGSLLFVGSLYHWPNLMSIGWFVHQVLPLIRECDPNVFVAVVGQVPPEPPRRPSWSWVHEPGVHIVGHDDQLAHYFREAKVVIYPMLEGYGTHERVIESLAFGKSIVTTSLGAYGLTAQEDCGVYRCDCPQSFAAACMHLLKNPKERRTHGANGRQFVRNQHSPQAVEARLTELVQTVMALQGRGHRW